MNWIVTYKNGKTQEDSYDKIKRKQVKKFELFDDGVLIFETKRKDFIYRKRHFITGSGAHKGTLHIYGHKDGDFFVYNAGQIFKIADPDIEYTPNELL